jgi:hypothetical protein
MSKQVFYIKNPKVKQQPINWTLNDPTFIEATEKDFPNSAINLGDFGCVEVSRKTVYYPQQDEEWIVVLEEGDPINYEVREHIGNKLAEHFKFPIYVYIEW